MRHITVFAAALLLSAGGAHAIITIDGGTHTIPQAPGQQIPIVYASSPVENIDAAVIQGEVVGGPGGTTPLQVTDLILCGPPTTLPCGPMPDVIPPPFPPGYFSGDWAAPSGTVPANGILAVLVVDTTDAPPGDYALILDGTNVYGPQASPRTELELVSQKINGVITVTPEPATGLLLLVLCPLLRRVRRI